MNKTIEQTITNFKGKTFSSNKSVLKWLEDSLNKVYQKGFDDGKKETKISHDRGGGLADLL